MYNNNFASNCKKTVWTLLVIAALALISLFMLISCGDSNNNDTNDDGVGSACLLYGEVGKNAYEVTGRVNDGEKNIVIPSKHNGKPVIGIDDLAFQNDGLTSIVIPDTVKYIGNSAFRACTELCDVRFGSGLKRIDGYAFVGCEKLEKIELKDGIEYIEGGWGMFRDTAFYANKSNWQDGALYCGKYCLATDSQYEFPDNTLTIRNGCVLVARNALNEALSAQCSKVVFPDSVVTVQPITDREYLGRLSEVKFGSGIRNLGPITYYIVRDNSVKIVDNCLMEVGTEVEDLVIGKDIRAIQDGALSRVNMEGDLKTITVEKNNPVYYSENNCIIERATKKLVGGCKNSRIPADIKEIGVQAFQYVEFVEKQTIPNGVIKICDAALGGSNIEHEIPDSVKEIGQSCFPVIGGTFKLGKGVEMIGSNAFGISPKVYYKGSVEDFCRIKATSILNLIRPGSPIDELYINNSKVEEINVPSGIERVNIMTRVSGLKSLVLSDTVTNIGYGVFDYGNDMEKIVLGKGYKKYIGGRGISSVCDRIEYRGGVADWCAVEEGSSTFPRVLGQCKEFYIDGNLAEDLVIPEGVTYIGRYAFAGYQGLKSVRIPTSVKDINMSFTGCTNLTSVQIASPAGWEKDDGSAVSESVLSDAEAAAQLLRSGNTYSETDEFVSPVCLHKK